MKISDLNEKLALFANLGVIVGIIFLAVELGQQNQAIEQSNRIAESTALAELSARGVDFYNTATTNPNLADLIIKLGSNLELTERETIQAFFLAGQLLQIWYSAEDYFKNGVIDEMSFSIFLGAPPGTLVALPGLVPFMQSQFQTQAYQNRPDSEMTSRIYDALESSRVN